jgi:hypothetical protein
MNFAERWGHFADKRVHFDLSVDEGTDAGLIRRQTRIFDRELVALARGARRDAIEYTNPAF